MADADGGKQTGVDGGSPNEYGDPALPRTGRSLAVAFAHSREGRSGLHGSSIGSSGEVGSLLPPRFVVAFLTPGVRKSELLNCGLPPRRRRLDEAPSRYGANAAAPGSARSTPTPGGARPGGADRTGRDRGSGRQRRQSRPSGISGSRTRRVSSLPGNGTALDPLPTSQSDRLAIARNRSERLPDLWQ